ncbi:sensor histidine kinase [Streptomyces sp. NPDC053541]|uniref:sensor histidine kinase n=1 Tax=Streptomyces sp. NPDC053541 TaxID=3365709 RepID=UPI0037CDD830
MWLIPPGALAGLLAIGLVFSSAQIRASLAWYGLAAVAVTAVASAVTTRRLLASDAARRTQAATEAREYYARREAALLGRLADQRSTTRWMADELLPAAVARLQRGESAGDIMHSVSLGDHIDPEFGEALKDALRTLLEAVEAEESTRDSSQRALVAVARRVQAIVHQLAKDLHAMQILHGTDIVVSRGLQDIDHRNALIGRLAASIAVLGDARPGRQWSKPIPLYDVLRGAMSRIVDYPRVRLQAVTEVAVIGPGAEPLIHLLAELLDNATTFSPPHTPVEVTASEVPSGIAIEIEDRGVGLTEEVRQRINRVMTQSATGKFLAGLGEVTQLGLPVVSRLAREHGCEVDLRTSAYGGVRAVILVPRRLITTVQQPVMRTPEPHRKRSRGPSFPPSTPPPPPPTIIPPAPAPMPEPASVPAPAPAARTSSPRHAAAPASPAVPVPPAAPVPPAVPPAASNGTPDPGTPGKTANGLPQRRRVSPVPTPVVRTGPTPPQTPALPRRNGTPRQPGLMWEAFNGDKRASADSSTPHSDPSDEVE